jgi:pimeloyl-ACP methyl ester carboxylesterase
VTPLAIEISASDGCLLRGQVWPGESLSILLLHDIDEDEDLDRWRPLLPALLAENLTVVAIDLRGHGASDGEWNTGTSIDDIATTIRVVRDRSEGPVLVIAAGPTAIDALSAAEREPINGVIALSARIHPLTPESSPPPHLGEGPGERANYSTTPRAPGIPKLFLVGSQDAESRKTTANLHTASIGWALVVTLPTADRGSDLLTGAAATHAREHILGFIRECRFLARSATNVTAPSPDAAEAFLKRLGITVKGAET